MWPLILPIFAISLLIISGTLSIIMKIAPTTRKKLQRVTKLIFISLRIALAFSTIILVLYFLFPPTKEIQSVNTDTPPIQYLTFGPILYTAEHIPDTDYVGYTKVYSDVENDRAIYIQNEYTPNITVASGDTVYLGDIRGTVEEVYTQWFALYLNNGEIAQYGMSGKCVFNDQNKPIGFVSSAIDTRTIKVYFY